jgi:Catalytic LigB subunit of aromatic ring-opening dioxygenase
VIVCGAVVPHAPVLLERLQPSLEEGRRVRAAIASLDLSGAETLVIVSPHGSRAGVYGRAHGSLAGFGVDGAVVDRRGDPEAARSLAEAWGRPLLDDPLDHGMVVPLLLGLGGDLPVIGVALPELTGPGASPLSEVLDEASSVARAIASFATDRALAVIASAHSSAALSARAPLTEVAGAREIDAKVVEALEHDPTRLGELLEPMHRVGGACGVGPLATLNELAAGWGSDELLSAAPYGVNYLVGRWAS